MLKIFFALCLLAISALPDHPNKAYLEERLRSRIDAVGSQESVATNFRFRAVDYSENFQRMSVNAKAAYFVDLESGQVLVEKNSEQRLPMASITKLMTALLAIETKDPNEVVTVSAGGTRFGDSTMGLVSGERLTVYNLLQGVLINSGSDAALSLARHVSGSEADFVALMNERATILGLTNTQFTNPVGWDEEGHYSTAHDLATLTRLALQNDHIKEVVSKRTAKAVSLNGRTYILTNTNLLLNNRYLGAKTGTTYAAGECLASYYKDEDKELVGVILNSQSRFLETDSIINYINDNFVFHPEESIQ